MARSKKEKSVLDEKVKVGKKKVTLRVILILLVIALVGAVAFVVTIHFIPIVDFALIGGDKVNTLINQPYEDLGVNAIYNFKEVPSEGIKITYKNKTSNKEVGSIDTSTEGKYIVTYNLDYKNANESLTREVSVVRCAPLQIHFMEFGNKYNGDAIYIKAGENDILVDAGSRNSSADHLESYIDTYCTDKKLEYVIATHADRDHISGFVGNSGDGIFKKYAIDTLIDFPRSSKTSQVYQQYKELRNELVSKGTKHYTALDCYNNANGASRTINLGVGLSMEFLYQRFYEEDTGDENDYSVCFLIHQLDKHYLFTGDLEHAGELSLVEKNNLPEVELFKAGHHGSKTSNTDQLLSVIKPKRVVAQCVAGSPEYTTNKDNTFPTQIAINNIAKYTKEFYVITQATNVVDKSWDYASLNGTVVVECLDGSNITVNCSNDNTILKDTEWFKANRTWPADGVQ